MPSPASLRSCLLRNRHRLFHGGTKPTAGLKRPLTTAATQQGQEDTAFQQRILQWLEAVVKAKAQSPSVVVGPSTIPGAGRGLFLASGSGLHPKGSILTLYPGLSYLLPADVEPLQHADEAMAGPPDFMLGNAYLLRVGLPFTVQRKGHGAVRIVHDFLLDGQPSGLSAQLFRAVVERRQQLLGQAWGGVNDAWLEDKDEDGEGQKQSAERACIALGHLINDPQGSVEEKANVAFQAARLCLQDARERGLLPLIPTLPASAARDKEGERVVVAAVALKDLEASDSPLELFVAYGQDPSSVGMVY